jgi:LytS/YehU family sensor histidine kinase
MKLKESWIYWICQIAGWGSYSVIGFAIATSFAGWRPDIALGFILFFLYSIGFTHLLRLQIRKGAWLSLPALRGLPRIFGCALVIAAVQTLLVVTIARLLYGRAAFDTTATISAFSGIVFMTSAWTSIYVGATWYRRYREAQVRAMQAQMSLQEAELRALQAQVNPHFLFNSLNTIRGTVRDNPEQAEDMITSLSNLFRRSLRADGTQMIPLAEEMATVSDYLALETARFEQRLSVRVDVLPEAEQCLIPAMLVQTLVENAVKHGISKLPEGGIVSVRATVENECLIMKIENTGRLRPADGNGTHTGLSNARDRLRLLCGGQASLSVTDNGGMVAARVVIPQRA